MCPVVAVNSVLPLASGLLNRTSPSMASLAALPMPEDDPLVLSAIRVARGFTKRERYVHDKELAPLRDGPAFKKLMAEFQEKPP